MLPIDGRGAVARVEAYCLLLILDELPEFDVNGLAFVVAGVSPVFFFRNRVGNELAP